MVLPQNNSESWEDSLLLNWFLMNQLIKNLSEYHHNTEQQMTANPSRSSSRRRMQPYKTSLPSVSTANEIRPPMVPRVAAPAVGHAPVHIDVGGVIYTSCLETLTTFPHSKLGKMFSGYIPLVLDTLKQHYFIDRDGGMFRHILNFLRCKRLMLPDNFEFLDLLIQEAIYFELDPMIRELLKVKNEREVMRSEYSSVLFDPSRSSTPYQSPG